MTSTSPLRWTLTAALAGCACQAGAEPKAVFAHFYYWYPINAGIVSHHAPEGHFDRDSVDWWKGELRNAQYAGVDALALMYWDIHDYNPSALEVLVRAVREMDAAGEPHPRIAMHLDGIEHVANVSHEYPLRDCNLTDPASQEAVAQAFIHFFGFFREQGMLDLCYRWRGKLVAFVYRPEYGIYRSLADDTLVPLCHARFREALHEELYMVMETAYHHAQLPATNTNLRCTNADNYFRWDAALHGPLLETLGEFPIATVGPGFDPRGQGKPDPPLRDRENGAAFRRDFEQAIAWDPPWLAIETFNFFEEGSDITETQEFGRKYLDLAHELSARFKGH